MVFGKSIYDRAAGGWADPGDGYMGQVLMTTIPISKILPNPEQPRRNFDIEDLEELAESIRQNGVILAVAVEQAGDNYILHDGELRVRAAKLAGLKEVPATIAPSINGHGQENRLARALAANLQRTDLNPIEEARGYQALIDLGLSIREASKRLGIKETKITNRLVLMDLDEEIQALIAQRKFSSDPSIARKMREIPDRRLRLDLALRLADRKASNASIKIAADRIIERLKRPAVDIEPGEAPAVRLARQKQPEFERKHWDMLAQAGRLPAWDMAITAAREVCNECVLREAASEKICGQCPGYYLLERMMRKAQEPASDGRRITAKEKVR